MATTKKQELAVIDFTQFSVAQLPELQGKKEEIASIIEANPIVEIVDNATYESAKKSRTAVKTLRTGLQREQGDVKKKIKEHVLDVVDREYDTLILGVKTAEQSRQEPIDVWEEKKEKERQEKARLEQERVDGIKKSIGEFRQYWEDKISILTFDSINNLKVNFNSVINQHDRSVYQEFEVLFDNSISYLENLLNSKIQTLTEQEQIRVDNLLIQEKNVEQSRIQEWQRTWNVNIDSLSFSDIADVKSVLVKSKLADLKHYVSGYEEIYLSTEKRLHSQIELISKAEEQRIAQEKFEKEKKDFEEKQAEVKRKEEEAKNPIEEVEVVAEEIGFDEKLGKVGGLLERVEEKVSNVVANNNAFIQEVEFELISFDLLKAETWDDVRDAFEEENFDNIENGFSEQHSAMKSLIFNWFEENYNVPSKKQ